MAVMFAVLSTMRTAVFLWLPISIFAIFSTEFLWSPYGIGQTLHFHLVVPFFYLLLFFIA